MNLFNRNKPSRVRKACQVTSDEPQEEVSVTATESLPGELQRRKQQPVTEGQDERPSWMKRGMFAKGGVFGAPQVRSARKFTK